MSGFVGGLASGTIHLRFGVAAEWWAGWSAVAAVWELAAFAGKATLLLAVGGVAAPVFGRRSAAARHLVWAATLAGVLVLPALRAVGPRWTPRSVTALSRTAYQVMTRAVPGARTPAAVAGRPSGVGKARRPVAAAGHAIAGGLLAGWALGATIVLAQVGGGARARRRARRGGPFGVVPAAGVRAVEDALHRTAGSLGVRRPVCLAWAPAGAIPMTWGVRRPVVLLPADAAAWPAAERDAVLHHELAHVRRGDAAWALIAELAFAACWFHPGVWRARAARLRWQERAADALAVASGAERHVYAATLVRVARRFVRVAGERRVPVLTPALVREGLRGGLAERVGALTAPTFVPASCSERRRTAILAGAAAVALGVAALGSTAALPTAAGAAAVQATPADGAGGARLATLPVTPSADGNTVGAPTDAEPVGGEPVARPPVTPAVPAAQTSAVPVVRSPATPAVPTPVAPQTPMVPTPPTPAIPVAESGPMSAGTP